MKPFSKVGSYPLTIALALSASALMACSSDSANPSPNPGVFDSGADRSAPKQDATSPGKDSGTPKPDATSPTPDSSSGKPDVIGQIDGSLPDVGSCTSDASTCNSCFTPMQNPLNACSPATVNCIPFDNTRVPAGAP